mgnify:CR=1 FL=1
MNDLIERLREEAVISDRPGQFDRLNAIADEFAAEIEALRAEVEEWKDVARCASEQQDSLFREARALSERADKLRAERDALRKALSRILENEAPDWKAAEEFGGYVLDDELREEARAALRAMGYEVPARD